MPWLTSTAGAACALATLGLAPAAHAATINVGTTSDAIAANAQCSVREAIANANANNGANADCTAGSGVDSIVLPVGDISLANGQLTLTDATTVTGAGQSQTVLDGQDNGRVFDITGSVAVTISNLTVTNGAAPAGTPGSPPTAGGSGGGIRSVGALTLDHVLVMANSSGPGGDAILPGPAFAGATGGSGGGIDSTGSLTITDSTISGNSTGEGGDGGGPALCTSAGSSGGAGGTGGVGGGVRSDGPLTLVRSTVTGNTTGQGGLGSCAISPGNGGNGGNGGGIAASQLSITDSVVSNNQTGPGRHSGSDGDGGNAAVSGNGGRGGGIVSGLMTIVGSTISGNATGAGGNGNVGTPTGTAATSAAGQGGAGAGIAVFSDSTVTDTTIAGNHTGNGGNSVRGSAGAGGVGGGVYAEPFDGGTTNSFTRSTISGNDTGHAGNSGGQASGGGFHGTSASGAFLSVTNSTVTDNSQNGLVLRRFEGTLLHATIAANQGNGVQSDFLNFAADLTVTNSIIASNTGSNCALNPFTSFVDGGHNVLFGSQCDPLQASGDPLLQPLADNGGPTETMALASGSSALDLAPSTGAGCSATDQRGTARPQGTACDAGAFEVLVAPPGGGGSDGGPAPGGGGPPGGGTPDTVAPQFLSLALSPREFAAFSSGPSVRPARRRGTRVTYRLSEAAMTTFRVQRALPGRRVGGRCVRPTRANRGRPRCTRFRTLSGRFRHSGAAGLNRFRFSGRLAGRKLRPGSYRLVATAKDAAANTSSPVRRPFRIIR